MQHKPVCLDSCDSYLYSDVPTAYFSSLTDAISIEVIGKLNHPLSTYCYLFSLLGSYASYSGIYTYIRFSGNAIGTYAHSATTHYSCISSILLNLNRPIHFIATFDKTLLSHHMNGFLNLGSTSMLESIQFSAGNRMCFGVLPHNGIEGQLFIIYNKCLSNDELIHRFRHPWSYQHHIDAGECTFVLDPSKSPMYSYNLATNEYVGNYYGSVFSRPLTIGVGEFV